LRDALGDSAEEPRYIETLPRRGYRFIAPLADRPEQGTPETQGPAEPATELHAAMEAMDSPGSAASSAPAPGAREPGLVGRYPDWSSGGAALCDHALCEPPRGSARRRWGQCRARFEDSTRSKGARS